MQFFFLTKNFFLKKYYILYNVFRIRNEFWIRIYSSRKKAYEEAASVVYILHNKSISTSIPSKYIYHICTFMYIIPGKKSASWQLVAVVLGAKNDAKWQKPTWNFQNQAKIKGNIRLISKNSFLVAVVFEIFSRYDVHMITPFLLPGTALGTAWTWTAAQRTAGPPPT